MNKKKVLRLIQVFFVLFISSGISSILDLYYGFFPKMFKRPFDAYEIFHLGHVSVKMPGAAFVFAVLTIAVFCFLIRRLYKAIAVEIRKGI